MAQLAERRQDVELALASSALLPDQCTSLHAVMSQFWSLELGALEMLLSFTKGMEVRPFSLFGLFVLSMSIYPVALRVYLGLKNPRTPFE
jgi:hypothetical protein